MSIERISRRSLGIRSAAAIALGLAGCQQAPNETPKAAPAAPTSPQTKDVEDTDTDPRDTLRLIGAFAYSEGTDGLIAYANGMHEPILIVEEGSVITSEYEKQFARITTKPSDLLRIHYGFQPQVKTYLAFCLTGWTVRVKGTGKTALLDRDVFPDILDIAGKSNPEHKPTAIDLSKATSRVRFNGGWVQAGLPTPAPGRLKRWTFRKGQMAIGESRQLTDVSEFKKLPELTLEMLKEPSTQVAFEVRPSPNRSPIWIINLAQPSSGKSPHVLEHGDAYFKLYSPIEPSMIPRATTAMFSLAKGGPVKLPCLDGGSVREVLRNPPDSEFCYQALTPAP